MRLLCAWALAALLTALAFPLLGWAADEKVGPSARDVQDVRDKAIAALRKRQGEDGSFSTKLAGPGVTALVTAALLRSGLTEDDPMVARSLGYLKKSIRKDGGIYEKRMANYVTCVGVMAFVEANKDGKYDAVIKNATAFLKQLQHDDPAGKDLKLGGLGYDKGSRPDMSNTQYFIDALAAAGVAKDDPAIQRALKFVSRCQNLPGEFNDQPFAKKASEDDLGGLVYVPDPDDKKHATAEGGLRSQGAMTYAGLKTFLFAGVQKGDPRVKAALTWIRKHYTLEENPGMGASGLFYYYHTFAKAMTALGEDNFEDSKGVKHDWRKELFEALKKQQREDGSFVNPRDRAFGEDDPNLATAFALLALSYTSK